MILNLCCEPWSPCGYFVNNPALEKGAIHALEQLASPERFHAHYGVPSDKGVLLYAVGDGNHSLACQVNLGENETQRRYEVIQPDTP